MSTVTASVWHSPTREQDRYLPEGPRAMTVLGRAAIVWVNIQTGPDAVTGAVHAKFLDTGECRVWSIDDRPGFVLPLPAPATDTLLVGSGKRLRLLNLRTGAVEELASIPDAHPRTIINDGEPLPDGSGVIFGTKDIAFREPIGHLYLYTFHHRRLTTLADGMTCSNGKFFRQSGATLQLYDIDTPRKCVTRYELDVASRTLSGATVALDLTGRDDYPDGLCADVDGAIVAFYNPSDVPHGQACRYDLTTGELLTTYLTPGSPRVTCPLLTHGQLYLTTASEGMPPALRGKCPEAGSLFVAKPRSASLAGETTSLAIS